MTKEGKNDILVAKINGTTYKIDKNRGLTKEVVCQDYAVRQLIKRNEWDPKADWAVTTESLSIEDHIRDMKGFAFWLDASCSKTVNCPKDYPFEKFENIYLDAYKTGTIKGFTTYRAGTMMSVLSSTDSKDKEVSGDNRQAPKRPTSIDGDVYHVKVKGENFFVIVGLLNGSPYEVFAGKNGFIAKNVDKCRISKIKRGYYKAELNNGEVIENIAEHMEDDQEAVARLTSLSLRHGNDIGFMVQQLEKINGDMSSLSKCIARCLKKYIKDGTVVVGESCPECNKETLIRQEGCLMCASCSFSKCL
jgi:ribonucleoside-diphosphate reductase alpha chain